MVVHDAHGYILLSKSETRRGDIGSVDQSKGCVSPLQGADDSAMGADDMPSQTKRVL